MRITLNTLVTYGRSVASLLFGLFSSRWTLLALGQTDYGLYGVVGSVIAVVTFLNVVFSNSITRFYAVAIGKRGEAAEPCEINSELTDWFNAALALHVALAMVVLIVGWPVGEWVVRHILSVPPERACASVWVLRTGLIATVLAIVAVPFTAMFTAWQRFGELVCLELVRSAATLGCAYWLLSAEGDRLVAFACLLATVSSILSGVQIVRACCRFRACRIRVRRLVVPEYVQNLATYAGWRVLGIIGWLVQKQGGAFAVNLSFGPKANASYAIAGQFATHASSFTVALSSALVPAIATETGHREQAAVNALTLRACKFTALLAALCAVPLACETDEILRLWLGTPPVGAAGLAFAFTVSMAIDATTAGIVAALSAKMRIGAWQAFECMVLAATCPMAWFCFQQGASLSALGMIFMIATCAMVAGRVWFARGMMGISIRKWLSSVLVPVAMVVLGAACATLAVRSLFVPSFLRLVAVGAVSVIVTAFLAWHVVLDEQERRGIWGLLRLQRNHVSSDVQSHGTSVRACPCAPLAIFAFNRVATLEKVLARLALCENLTGGGCREGYAFLDGARSNEDVPKVAAVRNLLERFKEEHFPSLRIVARECNLGNTKNMPQGIQEVLERHGRIIVVEDDILVSKYFLSYMDAALEAYKDDSRIWCVNAWRNRHVRVPLSYPHDVYLTPRNMCWGWGTWKDRWESVDFTLADWPAFKADRNKLERVDEVGVELKWMLDQQLAGTLRAWDVQCAFHIVKNGLYAVEPRLALTKNIGFGTECDHCVHPDVDISTAKYYDFLPRLPCHLEPVSRIYREYRYGRVCPFFLTRVKRRILRMIWRIGPSHDEPVEFCHEG